jgi:hypothetical protein
MIPGIRSILLANPALSDIVAGERIYTQRRWMDTKMPAILLSRISTAPTQHKGTGSALDKIRLQVSFFTESPAEADQMGALVRQLLDRYSGGITVDGTDYMYDLIRFEDESDDYDDTAKINFKRQDYFVMLQRIAPEPGIGNMIIYPFEIA